MIDLQTEHDVPAPSSARLAHGVRDEERIDRIQRLLREADWDALVCSLPTNVLMCSGYWPVVGSSLSVVTRDGRVGLVVPEDERHLAERGWADELLTFSIGSLEKLQTPIQSVRGPMAQLAADFHIGPIVAYEHGPAHEPAPYVSLHFYGAALRGVLSESVPAAVVPADERLMTLRAIKTPYEVARVRIGCRIAQDAFLGASRELRHGLQETEAAALFRAPLSVLGTACPDVERADGFTYCMSGPNSAEAHAAYQRSRNRRLEKGDLVLVHCNSYADGYWTDITRTYVIGQPDERQREIYAAVLAAREAALKAIRPGAPTADVDHAARDVLEARGFGPQFKHPTGHGVGFAAINHDASPRLHPAAKEVLEPGMVFNVEPGVYFDGYGGVRHCDMVAVTPGGAEVLTPFQLELTELTVAL